MQLQMLTDRVQMCFMECKTSGFYLDMQIHNNEIKAGPHTV